MRDRSRFGIAIAAMIRMIATTISSSISEKPFAFRLFNIFRQTSHFRLMVDSNYTASIGTRRTKPIDFGVTGGLVLAANLTYSFLKHGRSAKLSNRAAMVL